MATQADLPGLLSRLAAASLTNSGVPEHEIPHRQVYLLKMMAGILGSNAYARSGLEGGGDETALILTLRKELEAAGTDKSKLDKFSDLCHRLGPAGAKPGLALRLRTALLVLLRQLHRENRQMIGGGAPGRLTPTFSLTPAVHLGGLPATYGGPAAPLGLYQQQQAQQQQQAASQQQQRTNPQRPVSVASSYAGSTYGTGLLRPTSVITPSEMGDDPAMLSTEGSRTSLMGTQGGLSGGLGGEGDYLPRSASQSALPGGGPSGDVLMTGAGGNMSAITEPSLVCDVLYAAQGVRGCVVGWVAGPPGPARDLASGFRPDSATAAGLGPGRAMLLERLTELGWLFRRVREHISSCSGPGQASVRQALGAALAAEVGDYYRLVALLEAQAGVPIPTPGDPADPSAGGGLGAFAALGNAGGSNSGQFLTLRRLVCWLAEPLRRMRLLAAVGDAAEGLEGGALAGAVYEFSRHGDPFVAANAAKLLQQVCVPLYGIIHRWVLEGKLDDPFNEFFVVQHAATPAAAAAALTAPLSSVGAAAPPSRDLWRHHYRLDEGRLPPFIGPSLAQRILRAGKAIHYLNLACGDGSWVQQRADTWAREPPSATAASASGGSGELAGLEGLVSAAVRSVDERLMTVIWRHHRLRAHLAAIRSFLLLGQGDWVTAFMDLAQRELDKPASDVSEVQLNSCLRQALTATNNVPGGGASRGLDAGTTTTGGGGWEGAGFGAAEVGGPGTEYDSEYDMAAMGQLVERLRVRKERAAGAGETGWDVFRLHYNAAARTPTGAGPAGGAAGAAAMTLAAISDGPLSALFTDAAMLSYNRLAQLLWRLKRAEHALSSTWGAAACGLQRMVDKMGADGYLVQPVLAMLLRLRFEMSHFATNLQYYIQFEVMEASWQEFYAHAAACTDLDSLIAAHEAHLATLLRKAFLTDDPAAAGLAAAGSANSEATLAGATLASAGASVESGGSAVGVRGPSVAALRRALHDALSNMVSLRAVTARLEELVAGGARLLATRASQAKARLARGGWGTGGGAGTGAMSGGTGPGAAEPPIPPAALADVRQTLVELGAQHQRAVAEFTENLPEEAQDDVRFLLARLDFSAKGVQTSLGLAGGAL